jgi:hypothetical protein
MDLHGRSREGIGLANAYVTVALMDLLVSKGVITKADARTCLANAMSLLKGRNTVSATEALGILIDTQNRFSE